MELFIFELTLLNLGLIFSSSHVPPCTHERGKQQLTRQPKESTLGFLAKKTEEPMVVAPERRRTYVTIMALTTIWNLLFWPTSIASFFIGSLALLVPREYLYCTAVILVGLFSLPIVLWKSSRDPWKWFAAGKDKQALYLALAPLATVAIIAVACAAVYGLVYLVWVPNHLI